MSIRPEEVNEPREDLGEALSPFRAAFAKARVESVSIVEPRQPQQVITVEEREPHPRRFEVRIEKRHGKRSADSRRWNKLGAKGWELVAVVGEEAFFRRTRQPVPGRRGSRAPGPDSAG